MKENTIIVQKWFHIYDEIHDGKLNRMIKEVMDIYTNKNYICHDFSEVDFTNLQVINYTNGNKLPFVHLDKQIRVSIGSQIWCNVPFEKCEDDYLEEYGGYKHVKLSISFHSEPEFTKNEKISLGYKTNFMSEYLPHPEFHINLQKGMKLNKDSINFTFYFKNQDNKEYEFEFIVLDLTF